MYRGNHLYRLEVGITQQVEQLCRQLIARPAAQHCRRNCRRQRADLSAWHIAAVAHAPVCQPLGTNLPDQTLETQRLITASILLQIPFERLMQQCMSWYPQGSQSTGFTWLSGCLGAYSASSSSDMWPGAVPLLGPPIAANMPRTCSTEGCPASVNLHCIQVAHRLTVDHTEYALKTVRTDTLGDCLSYGKGVVLKESRLGWPGSAEPEPLPHIASTASSELAYTRSWWNSRSAPNSCGC